MTARFFVVLSLAVAASALPAVPVAKLAYAEPEAPANYQFQYSVQDGHTGDSKQQEEARAGDAVQGSYSLLQPDGVQRIVDYSADAVHGFNAVVRYEGHPVAAAPVAKVAYSAPISYAAPVAKVAYASPIFYAPVAKVAYSTPVSYAPVAKVAYSAPIAKVAYSAPVSYAAPVAKLAYAAPVAKVAYSAPLSHVTFASPAMSYHH